MVVQPLEEERVEETQDLVQTMSLLDLPESLLHLVLNQLNAALDLAAAAATCSTLRAVINSSRWQFISAFETHKWTPGLTGCLRWAAAKCPQLHHLDLSGATACCDSDLLPLAQISTLTSLCLAGLWRVQGASHNSGGSRRRRTGGAASASSSGSLVLDILGAVIGANRGLLSLDLGGTAVPVGSGLAAALAQLLKNRPNATKPAFGLQQLRLAGCCRVGGSDGLREVLLQCPALTSLDLSGEACSALAEQPALNSCTEEAMLSRPGPAMHWCIVAHRHAQGLRCWRRLPVGDCGSAAIRR